MDKSAIAFIVFCVLSIITALGFHAKIKKYLFASVLSAIVSSIIFQIIGYFVLGYLDPFFIIALITGAAVAFIIALLTGLPFSYSRKKSGQ